MITENFILENKDLWKKYKEEIKELDNESLRNILIKDPDIIDFIDLDKLDEWNISLILLYHPDFIKDLGLHLYKLDGWDIYRILINRPGLIKDLKPYLDKLKSNDIYHILLNHPKLIKDLKPYLNNLNKWYISQILYTHPKLIKDLEPYLDKLDGWDISRILGERPELSLFFKYVGTEYQDAAYYYTYPSEIFKLDKEEKQELSKKLAELIRRKNDH